MNANHVLVSEVVLARLDAALDFAAAEVASSSAAERRLGSLVSKLLAVDAQLGAKIELLRSEVGRDGAANDNPAHAGAHALFESTFELLGCATCR
jgi:hypothetical protein